MVSPSVFKTVVWPKIPFGITGLILFSTWNTSRHKTLHSPSGDSPCKVPLGSILSIFRLSPWTEGGFFIAMVIFPPLRLYEWSYSTNTCISAISIPFCHHNTFHHFSKHQLLSVKTHILLNLRTCEAPRIALADEIFRTSAINNQQNISVFSVFFTVPTWVFPANRGTPKWMVYDGKPC